MKTVTLVGIVANIASVVGVVIVNKAIEAYFNFHFFVFLSFLHFLFTCVGTYVLLALGVFKYKAAPLSNVLPVALGSLGSVAFMNLNLLHNSVGFYQMSKLACIPITLCIQQLAFGKSTPRAVLVTLIPLLLGMSLATVYDISINMKGTIFASFAVLFTSCAQIFTSKYQKELECDALQLLVHTSPIITVGMFALVPLFDDMTAIAEFPYSLDVIGTILLTCTFAFGVNISNYLVLGQTSPLTYQVLGHVKTILILILGFMYFNKATNMKQIFGIVTAMFGVIWYTEVRRTMANTGDTK